MKLEKLQSIADDFCLGQIKDFLLLDTGMVNYNYKIVSDKGIFIIKISKSNICEVKTRNINLQNKVLIYLNKNNFCYEIPLPIKSLNGDLFRMVNDNYVMVYSWIDGEHFTEKESQREIMKSLAKYHLAIKDFHSKDLIEFDMKWIFGKYDKMKKIKPKNKTDRLMLDNLEIIENCMLKFQHNDHNENKLVTHSDFSFDNILFKDKEVSAIIDFGNVEYAPRIKDIARFIIITCVKNSVFIKKDMETLLVAYSSINPLTEQETKMIIPFMILNECVDFWWEYCEMKSTKEVRYERLLHSIERVKVLSNVK